MTSLPQITILMGPDGYLADFALAAGADEVRAAFGTTIVPTPFTRRALPDRVLAEIAAGNPGHAVVLGPGAAAGLPTSGRGFCDYCHLGADLVDTVDDSNCCLACAPGRVRVVVAPA